MLRRKIEGLLNGNKVLLFDQLPEAAQVMGTVVQGDLAGPFDGRAGLLSHSYTERYRAGTRWRTAGAAQTADAPPKANPAGPHMRKVSRPGARSGAAT